MTADPHSLGSFLFSAHNEGASRIEVQRFIESTKQPHANRTPSEVAVFSLILLYVPVKAAGRETL